MHEIRKNNEEEKEIIFVKFKMPGLILAIYIWVFVHAILFLILGITLGDEDGGIGFFSVGFSLILVLLPIFILHFIGIKKSSCSVTNKRISGVISAFIIKKTFSYRLDEIDSIELSSVLGIHTLNLNFTQGHGPKASIRYRRGVSMSNGDGIFKISFISNYQEVYEKLTDLMTSIKNEVDLQVDIQMSKVDAENRKAAAFESIASNMIGTQATAQNNSDYIGKIKALKELLDCGAISQAEFDEKKAELLKNG